jgi:hypothetical protein
MTHNSPRQVGSADYLDFQTLSGVETLRRRVAPQPPRQAISKLELRDSLAKRRNIPLGSVFRYNSNGADIGIGVSLSNFSGKRKVMATVGQDLWRHQALGLGLFGERGLIFFEIMLHYQSYLCL